MPKFAKKTTQQSRGSSLQVPSTHGHPPSYFTPTPQPSNSFVNFVHPNEEDETPLPHHLIHPAPFSPGRSPASLSHHSHESSTIHTSVSQGEHSVDDSKLPSFNELVASLSAAKLSPSNSATTTPNRSRTNSPNVSRRHSLDRAIDGGFLHHVPFISLPDEPRRTPTGSGARSPVLPFKPRLSGSGGVSLEGLPRLSGSGGASLEGLRLENLNRLQSPLSSPHLSPSSSGAQTPQHDSHLVIARVSSEPNPTRSS